MSSHTSKDAEENKSTKFKIEKIQIEAIEYCIKEVIEKDALNMDWTSKGIR